MCMENDLGCKLVFSRQKISVYYTLKHPNKSVFVSFFHLPSMNTKIINQYRLTYTLCSDLNSVSLYESERTREEIFIRIKGDNMSTF